MRKPVRFPLLLALAALATSPAYAQQVGISVNGAVPNPDAMLDIDATGLPTNGRRGLLIPRMTEAERLAIPVGAADNGLLVFQTDLGTPVDSSSARGFWYYDNPTTQWLHLSSVRRGWLLRGNNVVATGPNAEFLGTVNLSANETLVMRSAAPPANPSWHMGYDLFNYLRGYVGLGTAAPATERLEVEGAIAMGLSPAEPGTPPAPTEGMIRYGTFDGGGYHATDNRRYHWGATDSVNSSGTYWRRLENAETLELTPRPYPKDTMQCIGDIGDAQRGFLSSDPVTAFASNPLNYYSPFATNHNTALQTGYRAQYLYRNSELVAAGLCFPATISAIAFFSLEQDVLTPAPVRLDVQIRGGAPTNAQLQDPTSGAFGNNNIAPFMDDFIRTQTPARAAINDVTVGPGWVNFTLTTPITLNPGDNLILDIAWLRSSGQIGIGPQVELENPGFNCTKWVLGGTGVTAGSIHLMDDNPTLPTGATVSPTGNNPHNRRPVTRFTGTVQTPSVVQRDANYIWYDGGVAVGSPAWLATNPQKGPGTVVAQQGVFDGNVRLSDHVFDRYFDGAVRPGDAAAAEGYAYVGLDRLRERLAADRHLPNMPSRSQWEAKGGASLGTITTGLWQSVEDQALYISQLEQDLRALEELAFGTAIGPAEAEELIARIQASRRLSDAQKLHLTNALRAKAQPNAPKP